jgi:putative transposase
MRSIIASAGDRNPVAESETAVTVQILRTELQQFQRAQFPDLRKRYWNRHFWARGYFSTTSGNITDDIILQYLQEHEPTGASR